MSKIINLNGEIFKYRIDGDCNEYDTWDWTDFYKESETKSYRKWLFFGPLITYQKPKVLFKVHFDIEDSNYTKDEVRAKIGRAYQLSKRKEEIRNGEII